jgi:hypothetical protein
VFNDWPGDHGEVLRGSRGDAAGTESGSSFIERITVNTGTVPVPPATAHPAPHLSVLDEPGRGLVRDHRPPGQPPRPPSARCESSTPRSAPSSTAGTTAATHSSGQSPQTKSWPRPTVRTLQKRLTSSSFAIDSPRSRPARGTASHSDRAIAVGCTKGSAPSPVVAVESGWGMVRTTCGTH